MSNVILGDLTIEDIPVADEPATEGETVEAAAPAPAPDPEQPEQPAAPEEIEPLSDEMLAKLDPTVAAAVQKRLALASEAKRTHDRAYLKLKHREGKFGEKVTAFKRAEQAFNGQVELIRANMNVLRTGDGKAVMQALQQLTGRDAHQIVEEMNLSLVGKKKPDDAVLELRRELAAVNQKLADRDRAAEAQRQEVEAKRAIEAGKQRLVTNARKITYPLLSSYTAENEGEVAEALANLVINAHNSGSPISDHEACQILEQHLTKLSRVQAHAKQPEVGTGMANGSRSQGTPATRAPAQSLTSQHVSSASSQRELTQAEIFAELADDPDINRVFGGFLSQ